MKFEIIEVDRERGIKRITTPDSRWYYRKIRVSESDPGVHDFVPSVTWIADHYPKGTGFYRWLASKGWDESEAIRIAAGDKGGKVHQAIAVLLAGRTIGMEDAFENPTTGEPEELSLAEWECLMTFVAWFEEAKPEVIASEFTVWNEYFRYAGTVDLLCRIKGRTWLIDFKTSPNIWPSMELQVSAYKHTPTIPKNCRLGILQLNYRLNKRKWRFTEVKDQFQLFLAVRRIWAKETEGQKPLQRDFPLTLTLSALQETTIPGAAGPQDTDAEDTAYSEAGKRSDACGGL
jgi:hypothetical protein